MSDFNDKFRMEDAEESETGSRTWLVIAGAVVALLAVMLVFVVIANQGDDNDDPEAGPTGKPTPSAHSTTPAANNDESVCGLPGNEDSGTLTEPPTDVTWELIGKTAIPSSESAGPGVTEDSGVRYCFARTPEGALLAATSIYSWSLPMANDPAAVIESNVASGPGYEAALQLALNAEPSPESSTLVQIRGFQILSYSDSAALVDVAFQGSAGQAVHQQLELQWEKGDWRVRVMPNGDLPAVQQLPDLTGFVPWAGA